MMQSKHSGIIRADVDKTLVEVVDINVQCVDSDPFGPITGGKLRIRGPLLKSTIWKVPLKTADRFAVGKECQVHCKIRADLDPPSDGTLFYCLLIQSNYDINPTYYGIILEPTLKNSREYYRRGYCEFIESQIEGNIKALETMLREPAQTRDLEETEYEAMVGVGGDDGFVRYQISLV